MKAVGKTHAGQREADLLEIVSGHQRLRIPDLHNMKSCLIDLTGDNKNGFTIIKIKDWEKDAYGKTSIGKEQKQEAVNEVDSKNNPLQPTLLEILVAIAELNHENLMKSREPGGPPYYEIPQPTKKQNGYLNVKTHDDACTNALVDKLKEVQERRYTKAATGSYGSGPAAAPAAGVTQVPASQPGSNNP